MHEFSGLQHPSSCHWSDGFQKITTFCRKLVLPAFWGTWLYQITLFDLANTVLASKSSVETICMNSVGYRTHRAVTGPMSFKNSRRFVGKPCSRHFGAPGCHPSTLIDLVHTASASKCSLKTIFLISEGYRKHRFVTGPMGFKKSRHFDGKPCSRDFGAPGCHPSTLIDVVHTALASKCSVKTIRLISEGYRTHRAVTGPMSFKKSRGFVGKSCSRVFGAPGYIKALFLNLKTLFWLGKFSRDHMQEFSGLQNPSSCHWSDEFQKITTFCRKTGIPGFWESWLPSQHFN